MQIVLSNFKKEILELRDHINYIKSITSEVNNSSPLFTYINSVTKKKFNYKSLIISLYGIVENYSEKFIIKYLETISLIILEYPNLKQIIKDKNIYNSASLVLKVIEKKNIKYNHLKEDELLINLNTCIKDLPNYIINYQAFTLLAGNLKHTKICELFKQIGIDLNLDFTKHTDFNLSNSENQFKKLDELVEMRNEVAHGNTNTLLDPSQIEEYVDFIEKYFSNLHKILTIDLDQEKFKYWKNNHSQELNDTKVFKGNIIGFNNIRNISVTSDSEIIIQKSDNTFQIATILNITKHANNDITIKLDPKSSLKENQKFHIKTYKPQ